MNALLSTSLLSNLSVSLSTLMTAAIALVLFATGCSRPDASGTVAGRGDANSVLVAAAADLAAVQQELDDAFERASGRKLNVVLGSSGILARQIEQGAPYDVYLSANQAYVQALVKSGKLDPQTVTVYAAGRLGIWSQGGAVKDLYDLTSDRIMHIAMANPAHAPYGVAAREALQKVGLWGELQRKIVYGENVRQALQYAESGNAEAALTAWSLLFDRGGVLIPNTLHAPIRQSGAVVQTSTKPALAHQFLEFLSGPIGRSILDSRGFAPPEPESQR